ncbi:replicative DNA helicase [Acetoanaerobium pronyense]|uniref:Replicative DNA helicase n=1 Tax=Acetoanaerobium pronyense TaxID=1482736 RepID=A0ABS4KL81_9FIRM|nr:replicative DNA helicase [Acetoanaerobium pronyense]MBP2028540.1 replicative DNA helicase [Acetoanaerobium pronyense]
MEGKILPHSIEAEQSVLGSVLIDRDAIITVSDILEEGDFYKDAHREIFNCMMILFKKSEPIDLITLSDALKKRSALDMIGGITYLTALSTAPDFTRHISKYAEIVKEKSILRRLIKASSEIMEKSFAGEKEVLELLEEAEKGIFDISQSKTQKSLSPISDVLLNAYEILEDLYRNKGSITGLTTGFIDLDRRTNGLQKTDLVLIAARPAMGKTAFSLNIAHNAAMKGNGKVAVFSMEMSKEQLIQRMIAAESRVELNKLKNGNLDEEEWPKVIAAMEVLSKTDIYIDDTPGITVMELRSKCRRLKMEKGLDLILIDYLQLMESDGKIESRQQEISKISRSLKILAKELECPVIALSQLSRAPEQRADHRPILSDLRESGAIEQDADLVMFLYRDDYYHEDSDQKNIVEVIVAKHRHGETGMVPLTWLGQYQLFHNSAHLRE